MLDLTRRRLDVHCFVDRLEDWGIRALTQFGVNGVRRRGRVGIWVRDGAGEAKIAAIGVRVRRGVTYHGIAFNIDPDLGQYRGIVPCGIAEHGVTSLAALGIGATAADVDAALRSGFAQAFERPAACR
jgi:lipoyl(octanoyl) transferase